MKAIQQLIRVCFSNTCTHTLTRVCFRLSVIITALFLGTNQVSQYQKGKTNLDFTEARDSEWQWHQLGHMQVCTSLQTDNHASTPPLSFFTARMPFLTSNQQRQSTEGMPYTCTCNKTSLHVCVLSIVPRLSTERCPQAQTGCLQLSIDICLE